MKIVIAVFLVCQLVSSCVLSKKTKINSESTQTLALGDSYTIGESVSESESFPFQWVEMMRKMNKTCSDPIVIARTGWRTDQLIAAIDEQQLKSKSFDCVTLLIGVNNEFQGESIAVYEKDFIQLVNTSIDLAKDKSGVVVLSIPDYGYSPYGKPRQSAISKRIDLFNASNKRISDSLQVHYLDITPHSRKAIQQPNLIANDGLHPSALMYQFWAESLENYFQLK